jgi:uncharacterized alpha-E superfamily protein
MLSRVADALYWMGRYLERSENITRLLLVTEEFSTETQAMAEDLAQTAWKEVLEVFPSARLTRPVTAFAPLSLPYLQAFFLDTDNPYSIHFSVRRARENARSVREALTLEVFVAINEMFRALEGYEKKGLSDVPGLRDALGSTHKSLFTIVGAVEHTMTRDEGWLFVKLGESMERILRAALILRAKLPALTLPEPRADLPLYYTRWRTLLRGLSSLENYRRVHGARLEPGLVIPFLLFDPHSPHSLRHAAVTVREYLERVAGTTELTPPMRLIGKLAADLRYEDEALAQGGEYQGFLEHVIDTAARAHDAVTAQYFVT